jgi:hypothetical protein
MWCFNPPSRIVFAPLPTPRVSLHVAHFTASFDQYRALRNLCATYVAAGENLFGKIGYRRWISDGALDILQPDLCKSRLQVSGFRKIT